MTTKFLARFHDDWTGEVLGAYPFEAESTRLATKVASAQLQEIRDRTGRSLHAVVLASGPAIPVALVRWIGSREYAAVEYHYEHTVIWRVIDDPVVPVTEVKS